ncbi:MAG: sugar phosphate isomerase/epimerase [Verrucomicrobiales bacterium]|nr:sugar phosphate isomerase/epimerase [Verrucomicrobiales bacterium]
MKLQPLLLLAPLVAALMSGSGCASSKPSVGTGSSFRGPVGLQLYSLRGQFTKSVPLGIEMTKNFGIQDVELAGTYNLTPEKFRGMLTDAGLNPVSAHFSYERYRDNPEGVAQEAHALGLKFAGVAWIPHQGAFDEAECRDAAKTFNKAGAVLAAHGIQFFYHCHGYEFEPSAQGTLMDLLIQETDPKLVAFEMDTTWVFFPGQDPAAWLLKYPKRWQLMHLKDLKKGVATGALTGSTDPNNDVALGLGQLNWPAILRAARKVGVKYYFIEDESAAAPEQIPQTLRYLEQVQF